MTAWDVLFGLPAVFAIYLIASSVFEVLFKNFGLLVWYIIMLGSFGYLIWRFS